MIRDIALVISDIDGTLVTPDKTLTPGAIAAVRRLDEAGIGFTLVSSRPPRGMEALLATLRVRLAFAAFNGGTVVGQGGEVIEAHRLAPAVAGGVLELIEGRGVDAWVFAGGDWRLRRLDGPRVGLERRTVGFDPAVVSGFDDVIGAVDKIVGVSDDAALLARVEAQSLARFGEAASICLSQPYYLDVTDPSANKGDAVAALCAHIGVAPARTAVFGDGFNDIPMFARAGLSIAMGQAAEAVRARADFVSGPNTEDGFAQAVERVIGLAGGTPSA